MPLFDLEDGARAEPVTTMRPDDASFGQVLSVVLEHLPTLLGERLFMTVERDSAPAVLGDGAAVVLALDAAGDPVVVQAVPVLAAQHLVVALRGAGRASGVTRRALAASYAQGPDHFHRDLASFFDHEGAPRASGSGRAARLVLVCAEIDDDAVEAVSFLSVDAARVQVLTVGVVDGAHGRRLLDVSTLRPGELGARQTVSLDLGDAPGPDPAVDPDRRSADLVDVPPPAVTGEPLQAFGRAGPSGRTPGPPRAGRDSRLSHRAGLAGPVSGGRPSPDPSTSPSPSPADAGSAPAEETARPTRPAPAALRERTYPVDDSRPRGREPVETETRSPAPAPAAAPARMPAPTSATIVDGVYVPVFMDLPEALTSLPERPGDLPGFPTVATVSVPRGVDLALPAPVLAALPAPRSAAPPATALTSGALAALPVPGGAVDARLALVAGTLDAPLDLVWVRHRRGERLEVVLGLDGLLHAPDGARFADPDAAVHALSGSSSSSGWRVWRAGDAGPCLDELVSAAQASDQP